MTQHKVDLRITNHTRRRFAAASLRRALRDAFPLLNIHAGQWSITLVNDRAMTDLHTRTMGLPTTTDVLTFDLRDADSKGRKPEPALDLDTVICLDEAARRAKEFGHPLAHEVLLYAIHSLLHVQGYDDLTTAAAARMHRREDALLVALGIGPVFASPAAAPRKRQPRGTSAGIQTRKAARP